MTTESRLKPFDRPTKPLPRLPPSTTLVKRPLLHAPIPNSSSKKSEQVVYVSSKTPFVSAVKRVRKLLTKQEPKISLDEVSNQYRDARNRASRGRYKRGRGRDRNRGGKIRDITHDQGNTNNSDNGKKDVLIKATGKAIEKALSLALYFQQQKDVKISIKTGTIDAIDDYFNHHDCTENTEDQNENNQGSTEPSIAISSSVSISESLAIRDTTSRKRKSAELGDDPPSSVSPPTAPISPDSENYNLSTSRATLSFYTKNPNKKPKLQDSRSIDSPESIGMDIEETIAPSPHGPTDVGGLDVTTTAPSSHESGTEKHTDLAKELPEDREGQEDQEEQQDQYTKIRKLSFIEIGVSLIGKDQYNT